MDGIKVRVAKSQGAIDASAVNQRRLQSSSTLNRKFVKRPTIMPRINASAGAASRALKAQNANHVLMTKKQTVKIQPTAAGQNSAAIAQATEKVVQKAQQQLAKNQTQQKQQLSRGQVQQKLASKAASNTVSLRSLASVKIADEDLIAPVQDSKVAKVAKARMAARKAEAPQALTAQELKDRAIQQALRKVSTMNADSQEKESQQVLPKKRFAIMAGFAVIAVIVLGYLVSINLPDISVRVAAMHSGIEKIYPSYLPSSYRLDGLVKEENGRVTMAFKNDLGDKFTLMEEKSSWDSSAVLSNYVIKNWGMSYSVTKGQGLMIYISGSRAAWVNGGVFYVINDDSGTLSSANLHDIAVSL